MWWLATWGARWSIIGLKAQTGQHQNINHEENIENHVTWVRVVLLSMKKCKSHEPKAIHEVADLTAVPTLHNCSEWRHKQRREKAFAMPTSTMNRHLSSRPTLISWRSPHISQENFSIFLPICEDTQAVQHASCPLLLGLQQTVPTANLLSFRLFHLSPVGQLLLPWAVEAQRNPANHLLALHAALAVHGEDERNVRQLEKSYLEDKGLFEGGVGLAAADWRLALGHLVAHGVQQRQLDIRVWAKSQSGR